MTNIMDSFDVIRRPVISEKSTELHDSGRYTFEVATKATKPQIKYAVEQAFDVKVVSVNTMTLRSKRKRYGPRVAVGKKWKKAIVTLAAGESITVFEGV